MLVLISLLLDMAGRIQVSKFFFLLKSDYLNYFQDVIGIPYSLILEAKEIDGQENTYYEFKLPAKKSKSRTAYVSHETRELVRALMNETDGSNMNEHIFKLGMY